MVYTELTNRAMCIAYEAHAGQVTSAVRPTCSTRIISRSRCPTRSRPAWRSFTTWWRTPRPHAAAVALKGQTLTQWSTSKLDEAVAADIGAARLTRLAGPTFEEFCSMLDVPLPESTRELLAREEIRI